MTFKEDRQFLEIELEELFNEDPKKAEYYILSAMEITRDKEKNIDIDVTINELGFLLDYLSSTKQSRKLEIMCEEINSYYPGMDVEEKFLLMLKGLKVYGHEIEFEGVLDEVITELEWIDTEMNNYSALRDGFEYAPFVIDGRRFVFMEGTRRDRGYIFEADPTELMFNHESEVIDDELAFKCKKCGQEWYYEEYGKQYLVEKVLPGQRDLEGNKIPCKELIKQTRNKRNLNKDIVIKDDKPVHKVCGGALDVWNAYNLNYGCD